LYFVREYVGGIIYLYLILESHFILKIKNKLMKTEATLWSFGKVELDIPHTKRLKALRLLKKFTYLTQEETAFLTALDWRAEAAEYQILHIRSIIRKALLKSAAPQR